MRQFRSITLGAIILGLLLSIAGCGSESNGIQKWVLEGKLGDELEGRFDLKQRGEEVFGTFNYTNIRKGQILVEGVYMDDELQLKEFDEKGEVAGTFDGKLLNGKFEGEWISPDGKTKVPFSFTLTPIEYKDETIEESLEEEIAEAVEVMDEPLEAEALGSFEWVDEFKSWDFIEQFYHPVEWGEENKGYYEHDYYGMVEVELHDLVEFTDQGLRYKMAIFNNVPVENVNGAWEPEFCHVCGGFTSLARFFLNGDRWMLEEFERDCECGNGIYGAANPPELIEPMQDVFFLQTNYGDLHMGYEMGSTVLYDPIFYKRVLEIETFGSNEGTGFGEDSLYSFEKEYAFYEQDGQLSVEITCSGTMSPEFGEVVPCLDKEVIVYNPEKRRFEQ